MNKLKFGIIGICLLFFLAISVHESKASKPFAPPPPPTIDETYYVEQAIREEISKEESSVLLFILYQTRIEKIQISDDGLWASAWLVPVDPQTGHDVHAEPGLALVTKYQGHWQATLPSNPEWLTLLEMVPAELVTEDARNNLLLDAHLKLSQESVTYSGYKLPWATGETMALTQSTAHDRYTPSGNAHYAFDFAKPGYPSGMFNVHAARSAIVKKAVWTYVNGSESEPGNYLLLEDNSTTPTTYQLYLHLAQNSIPLELRVTGASVQQGQFIGIADDTGLSTGNHLHFMVHEYAYSYWGRSVDITFADVLINGGRPRIAVDIPYCYETDPCEETQYLYVSGNVITSDTYPPIGGITLPTHNTTINSPTFRINGWAFDDDSALASAQIKAKFNGAWHAIGSPFSTSTFALDWDLCNSDVPDGPITLALELVDQAGNPTPDLPGLTQITKNYSCPSPPPACIPNIDQVAIYTDPDFEGACTTLGLGNYASPSSLGSVGGDNATSIMVGANVKASLFSLDSYLGRGETLLIEDSNLSDNLIGADTISSIQVQSLSALPSMPRLVYPANNTVFTSDASISLSWENAGGATLFQSRLLLNAVEVINSGWRDQPYWHIGSLPAGNYTWQVRASNSAGQSDWSGTRSLVIQTINLSASPVASIPYFESLETLASDWTHSNYWDLTDEINHTSGGMVSWMYDTNSIGYDTGTANAGYLTTPLIRLPAEQDAYLRFWYFHETESPELHWDQRWVQISANNSPFTNLYQLSNDATQVWLSSPAIPLAAYAGMDVRIRFYFVTLDGFLNQYKGWYIDDISITLDAPPNCLDTDNTASTAGDISYENSYMGLICPAGDFDYFRFQGSAGDRIGIQLEAASLGSSLDSFISLYDSDGASLLAENDDIVPFELSDSMITYDLKRSGDYYVRVRAWDHPGSGDYTDYYKLHLFMDKQDPYATIITPQDGQMLPQGTIQFLVSASDTQSGVSHVIFFEHSPDWQSEDWRLLGQDWDGSDGWSIDFDSSTIESKTSIALYAMIFDMAGNSVGLGSYNLHLPFIYLPVIMSIN